MREGLQGALRAWPGAFLHECDVCRQVKTQRQELAIAICNTPSMAGQEVDAELQRTMESKK